MALPNAIFKDYRGGLNTRDGPFALKDNEAQDLLNVTLTQRGALIQRKGKTNFDTGGFPADPARAEHIRPWYFGSTRLLVASINGAIYTFNTSGVGTQRFVGTAGTVWNFEQMVDSTGADFLWCLNGIDVPQKLSTSLVVSAWGGSPPNGTMHRVWKNQMVISGVAAQPRRVYFSPIANPESWAPATDFFDVMASEDDLDPTTWLEVLGDDLTVFKRRSVWRLYQGPPNPAAERVGIPGCEGRFMSAVSEGRVYYWSSNGLWSMGGVSVDRSQVGDLKAPRYESGRIENYIADKLNEEQMAKVRVAASRDRRIFTAIPTAGTTNNRLLELIPWLAGRGDGESGAWTVHDFPVASMCSFRSGFEEELLTGAANSNRLQKLFMGSSDAGVAINAFWFSSWKALTPEEYFERLRRVNVLLEGRAVVDVFRDFRDGPSFTKELFTPVDPDPLWDGGVWDGGTWDPVGKAALGRIRPETRGRYHAIKISNNLLDKTFKIYSVELVARGRKEH